MCTESIRPSQVILNPSRDAVHNLLRSSTTGTSPTTISYSKMNSAASGSLPKMILKCWRFTWAEALNQGHTLAPGAGWSTVGSKRRVQLAWP